MLDTAHRGDRRLRRRYGAGPRAGPGGRPLARMGGQFRISVVVTRRRGAHSFGPYVDGRHRTRWRRRGVLLLDARARSAVRCAGRRGVQVVGLARSILKVISNDRQRARAAPDRGARSIRKGGGSGHGGARVSTGGLVGNLLRTGRPGCRLLRLAKASPARFNGAPWRAGRFCRDHSMSGSAGPSRFPECTRPRRGASAPPRWVPVATVRKRTARILVPPDPTHAIPPGCGRRAPRRSRHPRRSPTRPGRSRPQRARSDASASPAACGQVAGTPPPRTRAGGACVNFPASQQPLRRCSPGSRRLETGRGRAREPCADQIRHPRPRERPHGRRRNHGT